MTKELNVSEVRKTLSGLIDELSETNEEIVITRRGKPIAKITKIEPEHAKRHPLRGLGIWVSDDFDEPMDELWESLDKDLDPA